MRIIKKKNRLGYTYYYDKITKRFTNRANYIIQSQDRAKKRIKKDLPKSKEIKITPKIIKQPVDKPPISNVRTRMSWSFSKGTFDHRGKSKEEISNNINIDYSNTEAVNGFKTIHQMAKITQLGYFGLKQEIIEALRKGIPLYGSLHYIVYERIGIVGKEKYQGRSFGEYSIGGAFLEEELTITELRELLYLMRHV